jgi:hypothetical protein
VPTGTITLVEQAAWSWFEDERVVFTDGGASLTTSAVVGGDATTPAPGTVVLSEVDLATGARRLVDLGVGEVDDHNSASIHEAPTGELTTAWTRHHMDPLVRTQRQRTDGSWLRLPPVDLGSRATYSNLRSAADQAGQPVLYDFVRGERFDPEVIASADVGRTWARLGRVLRDPLDGAYSRPYVQYSPAHDGRIDLIATETHPRDSQTSVYHGFIQAGRLYDSAGTLLGPLGSAVPVTALTRVWAPSSAERAWTADIALDPVTGLPTVVFSVRWTADDHRYWFGRWSGSAWQVEEIAYAGQALTSIESDYTGLVTLDPADASHVVLSSDADPVTGAPLISATDGQRHWELWDGRRSPSGRWSWNPLTADSRTDNIRPVLAADPSGASALAWLRGRYQSFTTYDVDVVAVVRRPGGSTVGAGPVEWSPTTDVLPTPAPRSQGAQPVVGHFDGHLADDVFLVRPGGGPEDLFLGDEQRHPTPVAARAVTGTYTPIPGDYDGNGRTDIYWYAPGTAPDHLWSTTGVARMRASTPRQVTGTYTPIPGDYDGNGRTDIYWYAPGTAPDHLWTATPTGFTTSTPRQVTGTYTPIPGDYDGNGADDVHWYAPGEAMDFIWWSEAGPVTSTSVAAVNL